MLRNQAREYGSGLNMTTTRDPVRWSWAILPVLKGLGIRDKNVQLGGERIGRKMHREHHLKVKLCPTPLILFPEK